MRTREKMVSSQCLENLRGGEERGPLHRGGEGGTSKIKLSFNREKNKPRKG